MQDSFDVTTTDSQLVEAQTPPASLAGFGARVLAYVIDVVPITFLIALFFYVLLGFDQSLEQYLSDRSDRDARVEVLMQQRYIRNLSFLVYLLYCAVAECSAMQGTFGKRLLGLRVTDKDGKRLTFGRSVWRNFAKFFSAIPLGLGFLWVVWSKQKQAWHDSLAKTFVRKS